VICDVGDSWKLREVMFSIVQEMLDVITSGVLVFYTFVSFKFNVVLKFVGAV
jgi:hypothetical protein